MKQPVILLESGNSYECKAIKDHLGATNNPKEPVTGQILSTKDQKRYIPNYALMHIIEEWKVIQKVKQNPFEYKTKNITANNEAELLEKISELKKKLEKQEKIQEKLENDVKNLNQRNKKLEGVVIRENPYQNISIQFKQTVKMHYNQYSSLFKKLKNPQKNLLHPRKDINVSKFFYFALSNGYEDIFMYELARDVYVCEIKREKQTKFEDLIKLIEIETPDEQKAGLCKENYRRFILITKYFYYGLQSLVKENTDINKAVNSFRMALAYELSSDLKVGRREELINYLSVALYHYCDHGQILLLKSKSGGCISLYEMFLKFVPILLFSERFVAFTKVKVVDPFFETLDEMKNSHKFNKEECVKMNLLVKKFQNIALNCVKPVVEKPSEVERDISYTEIPEFSMNNSSLAEKLKEVMEKVNLRYYYTILKIINPKEKSLLGFPNLFQRKKNYAKYSNFFKPRSG